MRCRISRDEKAPLVEWRGYEDEAAYLRTIEVHPLRYLAVFRAATTGDLALADDPLYDYIENRPFHKSSRGRCFTRLAWYVAKAKGALILSVDDGDAYLTFNVPDQRIGALERTLYRLSEALCKGLSREQHAARLNYHLKPDPRVLICKLLQRLREWRNEEALAIQAALGDRVHEMFRIDGFATHPAKRHRGYGSALLAAANVRADELGLASWLTTSSVKHTSFFERFGFATVHEYRVGEANPRWQAPPVVMRIMVREPQKTPMAGHSLDYLSVYH